MPALQDKTVLIIGRDSRTARAVALAVSQGGGRVVDAGLHPDELAEANRGTDIGIEHVDVTDELSIAALEALTNGFLTGYPSRSTASTLSRQRVGQIWTPSVAPARQP